MSWLDEIYNVMDEAATQAGSVGQQVANQQGQAAMDASDAGRLRDASGNVLAEGSPDGGVGDMGPNAGPWGNPGTQRLSNGQYVIVYPDARPPMVFSSNGQAMHSLDAGQMDLFRQLGPKALEGARYDARSGSFSVKDSNGTWTEVNSSNVQNLANGGAAPSAGAGGRPAATGGGGGAGGGGSGGAGGHSSSGGSWGPSPGAHQGTGGIPPIGGAGPGGGAPLIDWNAQIGAIQDPGRGSVGNLPGLPTPGGVRIPSIFDLVGQNPTLGEVAGGVDEINRRLLQGQLDISSGLYGAYNQDPNVQANRGLVGQLLANPYSINDATYNQMRGQIVDRANQQGNNLADYARQRAASLGTGRDEGERQAMSAYRSAANQAAEGTRQLDVQRAVQNAQDIRSAIQAGGQQTSTDWQHQQGIATGALQSLGNAQFTGDAFLQSALAAAGAQAQQNANVAPRIQWNYTPPSFLGSNVV